MLLLYKILTLQRKEWGGLRRDVEVDEGKKTFDT